MCTRVFWNDNGVAMVVARTLEWTSDEPRLWAVPRGTPRSGIAGDGSASWISQYGSITRWTTSPPSPRHSPAWSGSASSRCRCTAPTSAAT